MSLHPSSEPKFRVAICGAGIGGLVLAITIGKYDPSIPIDLYEARDSIETFGVGISLWKSTHKVLIDLGLFDEFKEIFTFNPDRSETFNVRRADIHEGGYFWFRRDRGDALSPMHRQHMVAILERHLPASCTIYPGKRLVSYTEPERGDVHAAQPIRLEFTDGSTATTDVLVGADGVRSAVRRAMFAAASEEQGNTQTDFKQYIDAIFSGICIYRAVVPAETLRKENPEHQSLKEMIVYTGKGKALVTYPIAKGASVNCGAMVYDPNLTGTHYEGRWVSDTTYEELVKNFDNFEPDARAFVKLCERPSKWAIHVAKSLPFCVRNRTALIGDAAHAMTPNFAAGAVTAIDDAFVLGRLIAHPLTTLPCVQDTLRIFDEIRFPSSRSIATTSLSTGWMQVFMAPGYYDGTRDEDDVDEHGIGRLEREGMETIRKEILKRWETMGELKTGLEVWKDAELELQALAAQKAN